MKTWRVMITLDENTDPDVSASQLAEFIKECVQESKQAVVRRIEVVEITKNET